MIMEIPTDDIGTNTVVLQPVSNGSDQADRFQAGVDSKRDLLAGEGSLVEAMRRGERFCRHDRCALFLLHD